MLALSTRDGSLTPDRVLQRLHQSQRRRNRLAGQSFRCRCRGLTITVRELARAFVELKNEPEAELVFRLNGVVALAAGLTLWLKFDVPPGRAAALAAVVFVALFISLLNRTSAIVAGALGSLTSAGMGALLGTGLGLRYGGVPGAWAGAVVLGTAFLFLAASSYRKLVRAQQTRPIPARLPRASSGGPAASPKPPTETSERR